MMIKPPTNEMIGDDSSLLGEYTIYQNDERFMFDEDVDDDI